MDQPITRHIADRVRLGFSLHEIVHELALIGPAILEVWSSDQPRVPPNPLEIERLYEELSHASGKVVAMFTEHLLQDEQVEKRYVRLLEQIADDSLPEQGEGSTVPLENR